MEVNRPEWEKYPGGDKRIKGRGWYDGDVNGDGDVDGYGDEGTGEHFQLSACLVRLST